MSITDIISKNEDMVDILEGDMSQLPKNIINDIIMRYNEINSMLENAADEYGDEPEDSEDIEEEDNW